MEGFGLAKTREGRIADARPFFAARTLMRSHHQLPRHALQCRPRQLMPADPSAHGHRGTSRTLCANLFLPNLGLHRRRSPSPRSRCAVKDTTCLVQLPYFNPFHRRRSSTAPLRHKIQKDATIRSAAVISGVRRYSMQLTSSQNKPGGSAGWRKELDYGSLRRLDPLSSLTLPR